MIISASRRTDIPAFYPEWFMNRLREKEVLVPNPYNRKKISRISLDNDAVDCIAFWTKNPAPMLPYLKELDDMGYPYYFQVSITDYENDIEENVPDMAEVMATFILMSEKLGKERMDWRFDPILLNHKYTIDYHIEKFEMMCRWLHKSTNRCILSFVDHYRDGCYGEPSEKEMRMLAAAFSKIASYYQLPLYTCAERIDLSEYGIMHGSCIDKEKIQRLIGYKLDIEKDSGQRRECRCLKSIDIGVYDTCVHGCRYCYATKSPELAKKRYKAHHPEAPMLTGQLKEDEIITEKEVSSGRDYQMSLFYLTEMIGGC